MCACLVEGKVKITQDAAHELSSGIGLVSRNSDLDGDCTACKIREDSGLPYSLPLTNSTVLNFSVVKPLLMMPSAIMRPMSDAVNLVAQVVLAVAAL